jgi:hypothetical protein
LNNRVTNQNKWKGGHDSHSCPVSSAGARCRAVNIC